MISSPVVQAAIWMVGAIVGFTSMALAGRIIAVELDTFELMLFRSLFGLLIVFSVGFFAGTLHQVSRRHMHIQIIRNLCHFTGQNLWFFAIAVAPLAQVVALEFTSPLWVLFLAPFVLGEKLTRSRILTACIGFAGVLIVARPGINDVGIGVLCAGLAAIGFAATALFTKILTRTESITCILVYLTLTQSIFGLICAGYDGDIAVPSWPLLPWVLLVGVAGLLAHFCLTKALTIAPAAIVMPMDFARLPTVAILAMLIFNETLDIWIFIGAMVIFASNYLNILREKRG
ncbi:MAG: DMT family transporter [Pseudoruegeria sp.]